MTTISGERLKQRTSADTVRTRLTDQTVRKLAPPEKGNVITYDSDVAGFGCRVTAAGARSFVLNYRRKADGTERRITIGSFPAWSVSGAREEAKRLRRDVDGGKDPLGETQAMRDAPTVADLAERYLTEHVAKLSKRSAVDYRSVLTHDVVPVLGKRKVAGVEREHIERLHHEISKRAPVRANRALAITASMFGKAVDWKLRTDNPCKGVKKNREEGRERYLTPAELERLMAALAADQNQDCADIFRVLLLSGARRGEVLSLKFSALDLRQGVWVKPAGMTKQRKAHRVPLSGPLRQLLAERLKRAGDAEYVFPGRSASGERQDLRYAWTRICKAAGIAGLRIHDLRHSHASFLVSAGFSLPTIGAMLGHTQPRTTARYAHLLDDPLKKAAEAVGAIVAGGEGGEVVPLDRRGRR
jgi:integrase